MRTKDKLHAMATDSGRYDQLKGQAKQTLGQVKQSLGSLVGNERLEAEGRLDRIEGAGDRVKGEVKQAVEQAGDKLRETVTKVKAGAEVLAEKTREKLDQARH